jgi:hypothetical protein
MFIDQFGRLEYQEAECVGWGTHETPSETPLQYTQAYVKEI